jgi:hypothetical protein
MISNTQKHGQAGAWRLLLFIGCGLLLCPATGFAQQPMQLADGATAFSSGLWKSDGDYDPLPGIPKPTDQPNSLMMPAAPVYSCDRPEGPYFDCDPALDPAVLPQPGWVADLEIEADLPRVLNHILPLTKAGTPIPFAFTPLTSAPLDWTAEPRLEIGHRLPDGFGEFTVSYRFLGSDGNGDEKTATGELPLFSRVYLNVLDVDYASNELSICSWWMKWHFGLRGADVYFSSETDEGGPGYEKVADNFWGIGPHLALELERRFFDGGPSIMARVEGAALWGRVEQAFDTTGHRFSESDGVGAPVINGSLGIGWRPPANQCWRFFLGYQYEYWWNVGRLSTNGPEGEVQDQGVLFRVDYNY